MRFSDVHWPYIIGKFRLKIFGENFRFGPKRFPFFRENIFFRENTPSRGGRDADALTHVCGAPIVLAHVTVACAMNREDTPPAYTISSSYAVRHTPYTDDTSTTYTVFVFIAPRKNMRAFYSSRATGATCSHLAASSRAIYEPFTCCLQAVYVWHQYAYFQVKMIFRWKISPENFRFGPKKNCLY